MSLTQRMKQGFLRLPLRKQVLLIASAALMISPVMPWYDERSSTGIGDSLLGIQGPFFLIGYVVMALGAIGFFNLFLPLLGKSFFNLKKKAGLTSSLLGLQAAFLMLIADSIFLHPDFGVNLSTKSIRFGMTFGFVATGILVTVGWFSRKKDEQAEEEVITDFAEVVPQESYAQERPLDIPVQTSFTQPNPSNSSNPAPVDPLTMDAKTRYRLMQARQRSQNGSMHFGAQSNPNFWGGRANSNPITNDYD